MKIILTLIMLLAIPVCADQKSKADIASLLGGPASKANAMLGKPYWIAKNKSSGSWTVDGWDITLLIKDGKIESCQIAPDKPDEKSQPTLQSGCEKFGFTKAAGWKLGQQRKRGTIAKEAFITHMKRGIFTVRGFTNKQGKFISYNFYARAK